MISFSFFRNWTSALLRFLKRIALSLFSHNNITCTDLTQFCSYVLSKGRDPQTIPKLKSCLQNTPNCSVIYHMIENNADFDVEFVSNCILERTTFQEKPESIKQELESVLKDLKHIEYLKERIRQRQATLFDHNNQLHEETLFKLWDLLLVVSNESCTRKSEEWTKLGFQGKDPATDFRGGGLLALQQLVYFAETRRDLALQMLKEASESYPFACVGIQCTVAIVQLVNEEYLDTLFYACSEEQAFVMINERYCELWIRFHRSWKNKTWNDIMSLKSCFEQQLNKAKESLQKYGYITEIDE